MRVALGGARARRIKGLPRSASRVRQALWHVLREGGEGSARELAQRARVGLGLADRELEAMSAAGMVVCETTGSRLVYRAKP